MPREWEAAVQRWQRMNQPGKQVVGEKTAPDKNEEYFIYQTLVGAWPGKFRDATARGEFRDRVQAYLLKGLREAKTNTNWTEPNSAYEQGVARFIDHLVRDDSTNNFLDDLDEFADSVSFFGCLNSLSQVLLK